MIESLKLTNYKAFSEFEITGLSPFTLLGGINDVGKTSILTAIYIYTARLQPAMNILASARSEDATNWAEGYFHGFQLSPEKPIEIGITIDKTQCRMKIDYIDAIQPQEFFEGPNDQLPPKFLGCTTRNRQRFLTRSRSPPSLACRRANKRCGLLRTRWFEGTDCKADIYSPLPPAAPSLFIKYSIPGKALSSVLILPFMRTMTALIAQSLSNLVEAGSGSSNCRGYQETLSPYQRLNTYARVAGQSERLRRCRLPAAYPHFRTR